ncbi:MAG TPA: tetratricopeptide repeat protein, partial [Anaerolineales bacterium]|nr:tetratricopeptide repeat protein [Anaerolineales bacterium]
ARRLITLDPLNETSHRILMNVYIQARQHSAALKQYQTLEQTLRKELNLDPQPETRELYKKIRKGDISSIPVAKTVEIVTPKHNLPHQISSFIGRTKEQAEIKSLVQRNRLVTLVGAGGIGKTSLSLELSHSLLDEFPNGVWFIALDSLSEPTLTTQTVASIFDVREDSNRPLVDKLTDFLRTKNTLLIIDNCEHLLDACAELITMLLAHCPDIKILATSREELNIAGEAVYTMPTFPLPEPGMNSLDALTEYASVKLFAERAELALTSFQLTQENIQNVVDICRRVDGIPLAIELAAARVNFLQVEEILDQLNVSFALLAKEGHASMPRHQTLQASLDWGWNLLNIEEKTFLEQLSVFAGGWTLDAAQAVCDGKVLGLTGTLTKKSFIVVNLSGRKTRYRFHEMVRQYANEKFSVSGNVENIRNRYLKYFLDLSEKAELELRKQARVDWMDRLTEEQNNIRNALRWADQTDVEAGLYISGRLMRYWESSNVHEGSQWLRNFIQKPDAKEYPQALARALHAYGSLLTWGQKFDEGYTVLNDSLDLFRQVNDHEGEVDALIALGPIYLFKGDIKNSIDVGEKALALSQSIGDRWREASSLNYLGWGHSDNPSMRFGYWEQAIDLYREVGDLISLANLLGLLGQFQVMHGDIATGEKNLDEALAIWETNQKANVWENPRIAKSLIKLIQGDYEEAQTMLQEVLNSAEQTGNRMSYLWTQARLGFVAFHAGNFSEARHLLGDSARSFMKDEHIIGVVYSLEGLAGLDATIGKTERAAQLIGYADAARKRSKDMRFPLEQTDVDKNIAAIMAKIGPSAFEHAYGAGQEMKMNEAVELALKDK